MVKGNLILPKVQIENDATETNKEIVLHVWVTFVSPQKHKYEVEPHSLPTPKFLCKVKKKNCIHTISLYHQRKFALEHR